MKIVCVGYRSWALDIYKKIKKIKNHKVLILRKVNVSRILRFKPDYLLFSAGFDAHKDDPLAQFQLSSKDFYEITKRTLAATKKFTQGKVISILEGGYDLNALAESANEHVNALIEFN